MTQPTPIYGHARGYRTLALIAIGALAYSISGLFGVGPIMPVAVAGTVGFGSLFVYAWARSTRRVVIMAIDETGFQLHDPTQPFGLIDFDEIEEIRIYALLEHPMVGFRLQDPDQIRRQGPAITRVAVKPVWAMRHYHIVLELDHLNDQVAAIKSVAVRAGIPIRSELI